MKKFVLLLSCCALLPSNASVLVDGSFDVIKTCPAYQSKNKKTNPANLQVILNQSCNKTPGLAESNVLALSWQPGFCQTYGYEKGKQECLALSGQDYQASHFVLHGLWPNQQACGYNYGFCNSQQRASHCAYPELTLSTATSDHLKQLMPSYQYGSCLERHEWNKHGTCQLLVADDYFDQAMSLVDQFNRTSAAKYIRQHRGQTIQLNDLIVELEASLGQHVIDKVVLGCKQGVLVDVYLSMPAEIDASLPLSRLLAQADKASNRPTCGQVIKISDFAAPISNN